MLKVLCRCSIAAFCVLAAAEDVPLPNTPNPSVSLSTCKEVECSPSGGNKPCTRGDTPGAPIGVGIAPQVISLPSTNLTLTLIDGLEDRGFTVAGLPAYEYTDLQLFVGVEPNLADEDYPAGCALMMQYQGQTFPIPDDRKERGAGDANTTSCQGVLDELCQAAIYGMVQDFNRSMSSSSSPSPSNATSSNNETDRCTALTRYVNARLREDNPMCGGHWISSFMNVTGGTLPSASSRIASKEKLGDDFCQPVLPKSFELYDVARMRQLYFIDPPEDDFLEPLFGGRSGFTPIATVIYDRRNDSNFDLRFACMRTFQADGEPLKAPFKSAAAGTRSGGAALGVVAAGMGLAIIMGV